MWRSALLTCLLATGCAGSDEASAPGEIAVVVYGEAFIEDGIDASDMNDGWAIEFDRFDVEVRDIVAGGVALADPEAVDVSASSNGAGHELGRTSTRSGVHSEPSFTIARVEVAARATLGDRTKSFAWVLDSPTRYERCQTSTVVEAGATATFQITIHADHLFYDSLVAEAPQLLFEPLAAADVDDDGEISKAELEAVDIGPYDPGNEEIDDLWSWLIAQSRTLGHVDGEGHCEATSGG